VPLDYTSFRALAGERAATAAQEVPMAVAEGKQAPAFTLPDADGESVALRDFRGKWVVLYFYPRDNTPGCTKEARGFRDLHRRFAARGAVVIGVSPDSQASHEKFRSQHKLPFLLLSDPDRKTMERYGAWGEKTLYGKKTQGVIRSTVLIDPEGRVVKHWKRVAKAADHPEQVLGQLQDSAG
jgi:peroxiredoxin Q/BCP